MNNLYQFTWLLVLFVCAAAIYLIRKKSDAALAVAYRDNAQLEQEIVAARADNEQLQQAIHMLNRQLDNSLSSRLQRIEKERAAHNESRSLQQTAELFQSLQPDLDTLCGRLLDAAQVPLTDEALLHCHVLAAVGSANGGPHAARYAEQLHELEAECLQRGLPLPVLTPASILANWERQP